MRGFRIGFARGYRLAADATTFTLTGVAAAMRLVRKVAAASGNYSYTGQSATLIPPAVVVTPPTGTFAPTSKYRYQHRYLFQSVGRDFEPPRVQLYIDQPVSARGQEPYSRVGVAPSAFRPGGGAFWEQNHGDYIDLNGVRYGPTPALTFALNSGAVEYIGDAKAIVNQAFNGNRWLAMKWTVFPLQTRRVYGKFSAFPPRIDVTYADGSTVTLACRITAFSNTSTSVEATESETFNMNPAVLVEFERPTQVVTSASLVIRLSSVSGTNTSLRGYLLDPRINTSTEEFGLAASQWLDASVLTHPDVVAAHRYLDEGVGDMTNFKLMVDTGNQDAESNYDPAIYGTGATNLNKIPHNTLRATNAYNATGTLFSLPTTPPAIVPIPFGDNAGNNSTSASFVNSAYRGEGFMPVAPGMGAMRWYMAPCLDKAGQVLHDGSCTGEGGTGGSARMYFKEPDFGNVDDIFVRSYIRIGTPGGIPFVDTVTDRYQVNQSFVKINNVDQLNQPREIGWLDKGGKWMMTAGHHCYPKGGFSASTGGPYGWQARMGWSTTDEVEGGPNEGGHGMSFHAFDVQMNPEGNYQRAYNYGVGSGAAPMTAIGYGGMATMYAHKWYCVEIRHRLNTLLSYYPGFVDDGMMQAWVDGRLIITKRNMVLRQWPVWRGTNTSAHSTALPLDQWAAIRASGFASGEGWCGALVRHNRSLSFTSSGDPASGGVRYYAAVLSRYSATHAVVGLTARKSTQNPMWLHLALTDPIPWADGDELRLEASGTTPTILTVKQNGTALTLRWFTSATQFPNPSGATHDPNAFPNPASTAQTSGTSYSDSGNSEMVTASSIYAGLFSMNVSETNGLRIDSWSAGALDGSVSLSDAFNYANGDLGTTHLKSTSRTLGVTTTFTSYDPNSLVPCPLVVRSGAVVAAPLHRLDRNAQLLSVRRIGARNILFNWFHGGQTLNAEHRYLFVSGVVASKSYIGPMVRYPTGVDEPKDASTTSSGDLSALGSQISISTATPNTWIDTGITPSGAWAVRSMIYGAKNAVTGQVGGSGEEPGNLNAGAEDTITNSNGIAWDPTTGQAFWMGGGHGGYPGNEVYCTDFEQRDWFRLNDPSPLVYAPVNPGTVNERDVWNTLDGTPKSAHTYDGIAMIPGERKFYIIHGSPWPDGEYLGDLWTFDIDAKVWTKLSSINQSTGGTVAQPMSPLEAYEPHMYWVPSEERFLIGWRRAWRWYDPATNTVYPMNTPGADVGLTAGCVTDTGLFQFWNNNTTGAGSVDFLPFSSVGTAAPTTVTPAAFSALGTTWNQDVCYRWNNYLWDPVRRMIIAWSNNKRDHALTKRGKRVFALDFNFNGLGNRLFEFVQPSGAWFPVCQALGTFSRFQYIAQWDAYLGLNNTAVANGWTVFKPGAMTQIA